MLTVLGDLPCSPLQEETNAPASGLDQLDGSGVGHVPGALSVDLDDLVPDLGVREGNEVVNRERKYVCSTCFSGRSGPRPLK